MALIPIQGPAPRQRKLSNLEQIALGVDIATKIVGTGLQGVQTFREPKESELDKFIKAQTLQATVGREQRAQAEEQRKQLRSEREAQIPVLTPAQKKVDENFAKEVVDFRNRGGIADVQKNIEQLETVSRALGETDLATGPVVGLLPKSFRDIATPEGAALQDQVEEVVQRNLRLILGAQFTEKEGTRLIERAFNPRLDEAENKKRVDRLLRQIQSAANAKIRSIQFFEEKGTLKGFKGKLIRALNDVVPNAEEIEKDTRDVALEELQ